MRSVVFANDQVYHIFNRGVEKRPTFLDKREYSRAILAADYYRYANPPLRLSKVLQLNTELERLFFENVRKEGKLMVEILCYCLMPNHFHFLLRQLKESGITRFMTRFTDSYAKYFNTKHKRSGPLFQGRFKAVRIEDDNQLLHVSRYIHLNPVVSYVVSEDQLDAYPWSSMGEYLGLHKNQLSSKDLILGQFKDAKAYRVFVHDQIDDAKTLQAIEHLTIDNYDVST